MGHNRYFMGNIHIGFYNFANESDFVLEFKREIENNER